MSGFLIKEKLDRGIYSTYNAFSEIRFWLDFKLKNDLKRNVFFKNLHSGQRCFILATAPSINDLTVADVDCLSREITIGVNSMYKSKTLDQIIPKYYALLDNNYWGVSSGEFLQIAKKYSGSPPTFITDVRGRQLAASAAPNNQHIILRAKNYPIKSIRFDPSRNMSIAMNVVGSSILMAIYMGFKEIYLLGCDFNSFCGAGALHCYDDAEELEGLPKYSLSFYLKYYHITAEFHYLIARLAKKESVQIVNLSEKSLLDAYPRRSFKSVLGVL